MGKYDAMTVNERLFVAGPFDDYDRALAENDEAAFTEVLAKVDLRRDDNGMNWSIHNVKN